ncbi:hypothetical protein AZI86_00735 [Bdellovibrio bacteriovorus]|uniref:Uncharacterized protein n=1 Tax=Bdellovibrio bacteriovorus TaxID=959 RepID=A0A150WMV5_BDEBC|nr:hypothetical protein [Bdellovibrio bacteriovorus]KYG65637.1 hypothetical protein AZI86_00735 [Bdellovibrio bacteriovorus]
MKLFSVILAISFVTVSSWAEIPVRSERSLRVQFDSYMELLKKEIQFNKDKDKKKRFSLLDQALNQMKILRQEIGMTDSPDAAHMDQVIAALNSLPSQKQFKRKNCDSYQATLAAEPSHELAADFMNSLCN